MRRAVCKDCVREERARLSAGGAGTDPGDSGDSGDPGTEFVYNESAAVAKLNRGQTRSDRCPRHRARHRVNIQGMAVPFIDLQTIGTVLHPDNPTGPLGGLGPMPGAHELASSGVDLGAFGFGMDESHIMEMLRHLASPRTRVLIVKAGTGTGKSTYMPYRLLDPPAGAPIRLTDLGPIVVTEPRVQATTGVAGFVGTKMSGADGVGPGYPVGFQVSGDKAHDDSCQLIYVTDGTMINWLREGRLSKIGTVIVDEAHERSANIDFILGYLKKELDRYPHLRVIITSATFDESFYQEYFGPDRTEVVIVPAVKSIGYGFPLFGDLDDAMEGGRSLESAWHGVFGDELPLRHPTDEESFVTAQFRTRMAAPLTSSEVSDKYTGPEGEGWPEDLHDTTRKLLKLRFRGSIPVKQWQRKMPQALADFVVALARELDCDGIYGDILGFLPTGKSIEQAVDVIRGELGEQADVFALLSSLQTDKKEEALAARRKGDKRKIVISTNLAETSLTVEGVRFVVDSGLIAQSEWDPALAQGSIPTRPHSQAGIRQRWGRVGRKSPGWVFPLYTKAQFLDLAKDTPPGSARANLEQLIMTAKLGGVDDAVGFDWPAAFEPRTATLDTSATEAMGVFQRELSRADAALRASGATDQFGDPTSFGRELARSPGLGSTASAIAVMHADRLACVPEVVTILDLLERQNGRPLVGASGLLLDSYEWPDEWRLEAAERHRALASACHDDAELVLQVTSAWENADPAKLPWEESAGRQQWARQWWVSHQRLLECAQLRRTVLEGLSPAMKEEVKRFTEPALARRARGAITRAMAALEYRRAGDGYQGTAAGTGPPPAGQLGNPGLLRQVPDRIIPLKRDRQVLSNIVAVEDWALPENRDGESPSATEQAIGLLVAAARHGRPDTSRDLLGQLQSVWPAGSRAQLSFQRGPSGELGVAGAPTAFIPPAPMPDLASAASALAASAAAADGGSDLAAEPATPEDSGPELDTSWPMPVVNGLHVRLEPDPAASALRTLGDVEEHEAELLACDTCDQCRSGNPEQCEDPYQPVLQEAAADELAAWRQRASRHADVSLPGVRLAAGEAADGGWYEVVGYDVETDRPAIVLRPDWRPGGTAWTPGAHADLSPGDLVDVIVGSQERDHGGTVRVFHRADGGGRFVLREAHHDPDKQDEQHQLAISLNRRAHGLLARLKEGASLAARAIPRPQDGCLTITFLELLSAHWNSPAHRYESFDVRQVNGQTAKRRFYPGVAAGEPNGAGYTTVEFLIRDPARGLVHVMDVQVAGWGGPSAGVVTSGTPVAVQVRREVPGLSVAGLPADALAKVTEDYPTYFFGPGPAQQGRAGQVSDPPVSGDHGTPDDALVPRGWQLRAREPLSRAAAAQLAALGDALEWTSACWYFWARSHHLQTARDDGFRPGTSAAWLDIPADFKAPSRPSRRPATMHAVSCPVPAHWRLVLARGTSQVRDKIGAVSLALTDGGLRAEFGSAEALERGSAALTGLLASPAALVSIPTSRDRGAIVGTGGENIKRLQAAPGIVAASVDNESFTFVAIGEVAALTAVVSEVTASIGGKAVGRMTLADPGDSGRLIGEGGRVVKELRERSGCSFAKSEGFDSPEWQLTGPTAASIREFIRLAGQIVPVVGGAVVSDSCPVVTDPNSGQEVADIATHRWGAPAVGTVPQAAVPPQAPPSKVQQSQAPPTSGSNDLLRDVVAAVRAGRSANLNVSMIDDIPQACAIMFMAGVARSRPGTRLEPSGPAGWQVTPPADRPLPARKPTGDVRRYAVGSSASSALSPPTTMLLMGDTVVIDMSEAAPDEADQISYYFAGLAAGLRVPYRFTGTDVVAVG
jgi:HrpA-like RNA helicase/uncharacterized protein YndB with AHSA1/START domain